jgi:probable F420-dependent oxidoreductase
MMPTRPFRFSVQAFDAGSAAEWKDLARRAEDLGYSTLFTTDHHFGPGSIAETSGHRPVGLAPLVAMSMAAAATTVLRVGCRVFGVDYRHPAVLAKELATLDLLSEGRLEVGMGAGWTAAEYEGLGIPMDRPGVRIERLAEALDVLDAHFGGEPIDVRGTHLRVHGFAGRPLPVQQPRPPLLVGGGAPRILRLAGARADIVSVNFDNSSGALGATSVTGSDDAATVRKLRWVREGAGDRFDRLELETAAYFVAIGDGARAATEAMADRFGVGPGTFARHPHALLGSVDAVCDVLRERRERFGFSYVNVAQRHLEEFAPVVARLAGT